MKISSLLLILITFLLCGAFFLNTGAVFGIIQDSSFSSPVKIDVVSFSGGDRYNDTVRFQDNVFVLKHAGGSPVSPESVSVRVTGTGNSYQGIPGSNGKLVYGDVSVFYENLSLGLKNKDFEKNNRETLKDGLWSSGETLILTGNDSLNSSASSVFVTVDGLSDTSNNYGFSSGTTAEIQIYQKNRAGIPQRIFKKEIIVSEYRPF